MRRIINENKQIFIKMNFPPFVDGSYDDLRRLVNHIDTTYSFKNKNIVNDVYQYIRKLEDEEKYPIKYMKNYVNFHFGMKSELLNKYRNDVEYPKEEVLKVRDELNETLKKYDQVISCPFPFSDEEILEKKKEILNILYVHLMFEKTGDPFLGENL